MKYINWIIVLIFSLIILILLFLGYHIQPIKPTRHHNHPDISKLACISKNILATAD